MAFVLVFVCFGFVTLVQGATTAATSESATGSSSTSNQTNDSVKKSTATSTNNSNDPKPRISQLTVENKNDFVLEPGKVEIFVNPGDEVTKSITVISRINRKVSFKVETEDFVGSDNAQTPVILLGKDKSPYSFKDNLVPVEDTFSLNFGQKIELPIKIKIPENAQPGGFYSSVIVSSMPDENSSAGQAGTRVISRVGVLFFVRVNGPVDQQGQLTDFRVTKDSVLLQKGPVNFEVLFENKGTVHLVPYGVVTIRNIFGKTIGTVPVDAYFSLPKSVRYRQVVWQKENLIGRYTATIELNRGYDGNIDTQKISFWVLPVGYIALGAGIVFILIFLGYLFTRKFELKRKK